MELLLWPCRGEGVENVGAGAGHRRARRRNRRVLLGLHHQPAAIAAGAHEAGERREVDRAVARHGEHAAAHAVVETAVPGADLCHHRRAHVLEVDMDDAVAEAVDEAGVIEAGRRRVAGVEQQAHFRPGAVEDRGNLVERLGHHHQVVVVGEAEPPAFAQAAGEFRQPRGIGGTSPAGMTRRADIGTSSDAPGAIMATSP